MVREMLRAFLIGSIICAAHCVPVGREYLADSLEWSEESVQADLKTVVEQRLERFFRGIKYSECVVSKERDLLITAVKGLLKASKEVRENKDVVASLEELQEILEGNARMVVESSRDIQGLLEFKSRFADIMSMSLGYPGVTNFIKKIYEIQRRAPTIFVLLDKIKNIPMDMLRNFDYFASVKNCAADIRRPPVPT
ncbi:uncharacterized protein LOC100908307 [Galendromus occidentalis]|uniref:Uncharacterized protein LOC100908307 n=1 Tax=Galendromus occidentalis TaxID=34638 RepID=A0AAJ6VWS4_9ACAR|nr:uncharacterized protein LOC100908307 [Galendromus occidentalis]